MRKNLFLLTLFCAVGLFGCATIFQPGPDRIPINSSPTGAKIWLDGQMVGTTPTVIAVNRDAEAVFKIERDGYESVTIDRDKVVAGWFFGNLLLGGVVGMTVDLVCHNQGKYSVEPIFVDLQQSSKK